MKLLIDYKKSNINNDVDGYIIGIDSLSLYFSSCLKLTELIDVCSKIKAKNKEVFISLNKMMENKDLPLLKQTLRIINNINVNGVMFDDVAIPNIVEEEKLDIPLIYASTHMVTSSNNINIWYQRGVKSSFLASEITLKEIIEIRKKTKSTLFLNAFGYYPMMTSRRYLVSNYYEYISKNKKDGLHYLYELKRDSYYPIIEDINGTHIYSNYIVNMIEELDILKENNIDYLYLNSFNIEDSIFKKVIEAFKTNNPNLIDKYDKGFLYKETIFKVIK